MDTQATTVVMELGVRLMTMCLPSAHITKAVDHLPNWQLFVAQVSLPLIVAAPFYCVFNFQYGLMGTNAPLILSAPDIRYDASYRLVRVVYLTPMLWIPCTNILVTIYTTKSLHSRIFNPLLPDKTTVVAMTQLHRCPTRVNAWQLDQKS
ncbi:unnamed protein product [Haemonchus placei]|uniref:G protein-coupled receptor n=1 Tax=Haemonchus placei TaxID=6290 RepID=A0A0N4WWN7_HAEPC|nr:unnamed protein product [Haemonchus placei]